MNPERVFEDRRAAMTGLAYRMLGSRSDAEDVVQDAWLRWRTAQDVHNPDAFLNKVITRLCLDRLKSARARREVYVGEWLPEPVLEDDPLAPFSAENLSVAFLLALERLTPLERAAFLLHDVFDTPFADVASTLGRSEAACRQLAARAREHVKAARPRYKPSPEEEKRLTEAFLTAALTGDADLLRQILAEDVVMHSDGGGVVRANLNPVRGLDRAVRFIQGILRKNPPPPGAMGRIARVNGQPGALMLSSSGGIIQTTALEIRDGRIVAAYTVRNPEKLAHLKIEP
jgi:RNA polymerase sigma-70 factor (ECF subfamily)